MHGRLRRRRRIKNRLVLFYGARCQWTRQDGSPARKMIAEQPPQPLSAAEVCRLCSAENRNRGGFSSPCQKRTSEEQQEDFEGRIESVIQAIDQYLNIRVSDPREVLGLILSDPLQLKPEDGICKFCCRFVGKLKSFGEHCRRVDKMFHMAMDDQPLTPDQNIISNWDEIRALCEIVSKQYINYYRLN